MGLTTPVLAIAGLLGISIPSVAVTASYSNDYRACAGRLISVGVTAQAAAEGCATALRPTDLSACVVDISKNTQIPAVDALSGCRRARQPKDVATCVVALSKNTEGAVNPDVLNYCGRSLLPMRFAQCVVGLRSEISLAPNVALDTCIDGSDRISGFTPPSTLPNQQPGTQFNPTFETQPVPANPIK
ncbi:all2736 [Nostoc sp. PCC 7120 = FACHB-418]|nr:all2736 [Nostoc sp. PCC 7120 = FACHB-418]